MKNRNIITVLSALTCLALLPIAQAAPTPETPDPATTCAFCTADGTNALVNAASGGGSANSAFGWSASLFNTSASFNTAVGAGALLFNDAGLNVAVGAASLLFNTSGTNNTAVGTDALENNVSAFTNVAVGTFAAQGNDSSGNGTAVFNTAVGGFALQGNVDGTENTAVGAGAMESGVGGNDNTAVGFVAGSNITDTGNSNTCIGHATGSNLTTGEGNIYIGAAVQAGASGEFEFIRIGNDTAFTFPYDTFIAGIFSRAVDSGTAQFVFVDDTGKLGTVLVNAAGNKVATPQAMLDESRNQQKRIAELEGTVLRQQKGMEVLTAQLKEQAAQIQKVSAQLEVSKPAPQVVVNKP